jgi:predicted RNA binding protein YcfA (HicA-like mRNA interferase family)
MMSSEVRFAELRKLLEGAGYHLTRVAGSHHIFTKPGVRSFAVPVHSGKVLPVYFRRAHKLAAAVLDEQEKADESRKKGDDSQEKEKGD